MPKGKVSKRDNIKAGESKRVDETDEISPVDKGQDFVKAGETAQIGH